MPELDWELTMRSSFIPATVILVLLSLVFLLPRRDPGVGQGGDWLLPDSSSAGADVAAALLALPRLDLVDPPAWVRQRGAEDEVLRSLDRLAWGSHDAMQASIATLAKNTEGLAEALLDRLAVLGTADVIQISKLVTLLDVDQGENPEVMEELFRRAYSESPLVAKAALRVLGRHPSSESLAGILARRNDPNMEVRDVARSSLARRVLAGDAEALAYVTEELEASPAEADSRYLSLLGGQPGGERQLAVLRRVVAEAPYERRVEALGALVSLGDQDAVDELEDMLRNGDMAARLNAVFLAARSGRVVGRALWAEVFSRKVRQESLMLMGVLGLAIETGDESAPDAIELIEQLAQDPTHPCNSEAIGMLFDLGHSWGVERTRGELQDYVGHHLSETVTRIERSSGELAREFTDIAFERLSDPDLAPVERVLLCRLLSNLDPARGADVIVRYALDEQGPQVRELMSQLSLLGSHALRRLEDDLESDRAAGLYILVAAQAGDALTLPYLEALAQDMTKDRALREQALDCIVRVSDGPRAETLRRVALALDDMEVNRRAHLLFWNYL
jgi:hypothetical protein